MVAGSVACWWQTVSGMEAPNMKEMHDELVTSFVFA